MVFVCSVGINNLCGDLEGSLRIKNRGFCFSPCGKQISAGVVCIHRFVYGNILPCKRQEIRQARGAKERTAGPVVLRCGADIGKRSGGDIIALGAVIEIAVEDIVIATCRCAALQLHIVKVKIARALLRAQHGGQNGAGPLLSAPLGRVAFYLCVFRITEKMICIVFHLVFGNGIPSGRTTIFPKLSNVCSNDVKFSW